MSVPFTIMPSLASPRPSDIRIESISFAFEDFDYRTPIKFGGVAVDRATLLNVHCHVRTEAGVEADGFGSMPLGNVWSFPSKTLPYQSTLAAMKALAQRVASLTAGHSKPGHPIDINVELEPAYLKAAD
ncbi:MAG TPA: hypothetical protein VGZ25_11245, partial [Gemmataceae bacterium]|nr:hypothetical protein [Gemmataceae bacterium]